MARKRVVPCRFNEIEYEWLNKKSEKSDQSLSEVVRDLVKEAMKQEPLLAE